MLAEHDSLILDQEVQVFGLWQNWSPITVATGFAGTKVWKVLFS